jgi:putative transposase
MPDHVHAVVWFPDVGQLSPFMNEWKSQSSSAIRRLYESRFPHYWSQVGRTAVWQPRYYGFNVFSKRKLEEKLTYMHLNPVRAGLVEKAVAWPYSSARWYEQQKSVGLPIRWPPGME